MPRIRYTKGAIYKGQMMGPGDELDVTDREAVILCDGYKDAVRVDPSTELPLRGMTVRDQLQTQDPVVSHRDPTAKPAQRNR